MIVRDLEAGDELRLREIHGASGLDYEFPKLESPLFIVKKVVEDEGRVAIAAVGRLVAEVQILCDPDWLTPAFRLKAFEVLHEEMRRALKDKGLDEVIAFIPPQKKSFARRLCRFFGWGKTNWDCYSREL